jgi:membrane protease subunit (stomatin/prohibitin family)
MSIIQVIKRPINGFGQDNPVYVATGPFNYGSQLLVGVGDKALVVQNGILIGEFEEGRHVLSLERLPLLNVPPRLLTGGEELSEVRVYFFQTEKQFSSRFGCSYVFYESMPATPSVSVPITSGCHGRFYYRISNPEALLRAWIGNQIEYSDSGDLSISARAQSILPQTVLDFARTNHISIFELDYHRTALGNAIADTLNHLLAELGLAISHVSIEGFSEEDESYQAIKSQSTRSTTALMEASAQAQALQVLGVSYAEHAQLEALQKLAANEGGQLNALLTAMLLRGNQLGAELFGLSAKSEEKKE